MSERRVENLFKIPALRWLAAGRNLIAKKIWKIQACFDQNNMAICGHFFSPKKKKKRK